MPKIKQKYEEEDEEEEQFEEEEEDEENLEEEEEVRKKAKKPLPNPSRIGMKPIQPQKRYGIIAPQPLRLVDVESQEVIGEGDYAVLQALTDVIERLERIENSVGSMLK